MATRKQRKEKRQAARQDRRADKVNAQIERKNIRVQSRADAKAGRIENKSIKQQGKADARVTKQNARIAQVRDAAENLPADLTPEALPLKAKVKVVNYLKKRGRQIEDENDPEILSGQFIEERARHIAAKHDEIEQQIDDDMSLTDEERDAMIPEYEDVEEMILEEEANEFSFTGDEDNFLDPETIAMVARIGKAGADKYKQKRFEAGKKAFGRTAAQDKAIQERKAKAARGEDTGDAVTDAITAAKNKLVDEKTKETVNEYKPYIIGGVIVLFIAGIAIYYSGKKS